MSETGVYTYGKSKDYNNNEPLQMECDKLEIVKVTKYTGLYLTISDDFFKNTRAASEKAKAEVYNDVVVKYGNVERSFSYEHFLSLLGIYGKI